MLAELLRFEEKSSLEMNLPLISIIVGTRPEAIKLAPVILAFRKEKLLNTRLILTGQHSEMVKNIKARS